jgi:hypothetical protein
VAILTKRKAAMPRIVTALITLLASFGLWFTTAVRAAEFELTNIPSDLGSNDKELWRRVMGNFYGKYSKTQKCWVSKGEGKNWCMRPHTLNRVSDGTATHYYMAVSGQKLGDANDCHVCTGALGLFVLSDAKPTLAIVARSAKYMDYGSWGRVPPEESFAIHRLGPPANFAWTIENGWSGQGITVTSTEIFGIAGDQVKSLGQLPKSFSDQGNCENDINMMTKEKCSDVTFETLYESGMVTERFASITLKGSGTLKGQPFTESYRVNFDPATQGYPEPPNLPAAIKP